MRWMNGKAFLQKLLETAIGIIFREPHLCEKERNDMNESNWNCKTN